MPRWIGSIQVMLIMSMGLFTGRAFDAGYLWVLSVSTVPASLMPDQSSLSARRHHLAWLCLYVFVHSLKALLTQHSLHAVSIASGSVLSGMTSQIQLLVTTYHSRLDIIRFFLPMVSLGESRAVLCISLVCALIFCAGRYLTSNRSRHSIPLFPP